MSPRSSTGPSLPERVASLETEANGHAITIVNHETRLDGHDAWLNQIRGSLRTMVVLWSIAVALLGFGFVQQYVSRPAAASTGSK